MVDLVLQGGGAKGLFQAAVIHGLEASGIKWRKIIGTSVGAINGAGVRYMGSENLLRLFLGVRQKDVFKKPWPHWLAYLGLINHNGLYDWSPLRELLEKHLPSTPMPDTWVTRVSSITGNLDVPLATAETVFHSGLMPGVGRYKDWYDGGVRENVPLGAGLNKGIGSDDTPVVVILNEPFRAPRGVHDIPKNGVESLLNILDASLAEGKSNDLREFLRLNYIAKQVGPIKKPNGNGYWKYYPVSIYAPSWDLGDAMDFDSDELRKSRIEAATKAIKEQPIYSI